jgi:hypothetical protein
METADSTDIREAFASADEATKLEDGRLYFWWD